MSKLSDQWIELFRTGNYGDKGEYSERDLDQIVANYNRSFHEAPAVIGHPENDLPAYGWVEAVKRVGNTLFGKLKQIQPAFEEMVKQGLFKKRSIGLYQTDKGLALRHVGFLGAVPPEIKGLADVQFSERKGIVIEVPIGASFVFDDEQRRVANPGRFRVDPESVRLSESAHRLASEKSITFAEALGQVATVERFAAAQRIGRPQSVPGSIQADPNSVRLSELAKQRAWDMSISFSEALTQVAKERPDLTVDPLALGGNGR